MTSINAMKSVSCPKLNFKQIPSMENKISDKAVVQEDIVDFSNTNKISAPKISKARLFFSRLTDEQIADVNKSGKLPDGAKFCQIGFGGYDVCNDFFGLRAGTQTMPAGYELKKNVLGFTIVVPKDTKGTFIKG